MQSCGLADIFFTIEYRQNNMEGNKNIVKTGTKNIYTLRLPRGKFKRASESDNKETELDPCRQRNVTLCPYPILEAQKPLQAFGGNGCPMQRRQKIADLKVFGHLLHLYQFFFAWRFLVVAWQCEVIVNPRFSIPAEVPDTVLFASCVTGVTELTLAIGVTDKS